MLVRFGKRVVCDASLCDGFFPKFRGLMFRREAVPLLFVFDSEARERNAIHSFFCPVFDAVFMDGRKKIVGIERGIAPWRPAIFPKKPFAYLLELPVGVSKGLKEGDALAWKE
ncbi:putative ACR [Candidatus Norongarragalina meridionalis]|nr:putative ACR [Candidatus Norongarragalina meridionalis]